MSISINLTKSTAVLAKYFAPIVSYEALKLDGNSSPINRYLRRNFCSNYKLFFQIIVNFSKNSEFDECSSKLPLQSSKQEQTGVDPDIRSIRTGECQILSLEYSIAGSRLHKSNNFSFAYVKTIYQSLPLHKQLPRIH